MPSVSQWVYWIERDAIWVAYYDPSKADEDAFTSPDSTVAGKKITVFYFKKSDHFDLPSASNAWEAQAPEIPEQFHSALVDKAISIGYERQPETIQLAQYFSQKFDKSVHEGRRYAYRGRTGTFKTIKQVDM